MGRRTLALVAVALVGGLAPASATAGHTSGDWVTGGGRTAIDVIAVTAFETFDGGAVGGLLAYNTPEQTLFAPFLVDAQVTCLNVVGNLATVGGRLISVVSSEVNPTRRGFRFFVEDRTALGEPDRISHQFVFQQPPETCSPPDVSRITQTLLIGDIEVHDG